MKKLAISGLVIGSSLLLGCTEDYAPPADTSAEAMFQEACMGCHKLKSGEGEGSIYFELSSERAQLPVVSKKIREGGLIMPKYPNIPEKELQALSQYVIDHSRVE